MLEARLSKEKKITLRLDEKAFGKELKSILASEVQLPPVPQRMNAGTAFRLALSQTPIATVTDYMIHPGGIVITSPRLGASSKSYDVRVAVQQLLRLRTEVIEAGHDVFHDIDKTDGAALLCRLLANQIVLEPWESIEIQNGTRLVAFASPSHHRAIGDELWSLARLADLAVVMNARLYELDRAFFAKHLAPLLAGEEPPGGLVPDFMRVNERPLIVPIDGLLLNQLLKQKLVLEGDDIKIVPRRKTEFLSHRTLLPYAAGVPSGKRKDVTGTELDGVRFEVRAEVSADRRFLRLHVTQSVTQLVAVNKASRLDPARGDQHKVQVPAVRRASATGTVQVPDGDPIVMPVDYQPPGSEKSGKIWVMVARPVIWIQGEKDLEKAGSVPLVWPKSIWDAPTTKDEKPPAPPALPLTDDTKEILQAVLTDVLISPKLKNTRDVYGTPKDRTLALVPGEKLAWPKEFNPGTHGLRLVTTPADPFDHPRRILGIRLDRFDLDPKKLDAQKASIEITILNAGGGANGNVIGACCITYVPRRVGHRWVVERLDVFDP
jgi:hypothetical protein